MNKTVGGFEQLTPWERRYVGLTKVSQGGGVCRSCAAAFLALIMMWTAGIACSFTDDDVARPEPCRTPDPVPFVQHADSGSRPVWASGWEQSMLAASADVESPDSAGATNEDLFNLAASCANLTGLSWDDYPHSGGQSQHADIVVGVQHYQYRASNAESERNRFVIGVVIERIDDTAARFVVLAMPVQTDFPTIAPDGAGIVQSLRGVGLL